MELRSRSTPCFSMDFLDDERGVDGEGDDSDGGGATRFEEWFDGQEGFHLTVDLGQAEEGGTIDRAAEFRDRLDFRCGDGRDVVRGVDDEAHRQGGPGGRIDLDDDDAGAAVGFGRAVEFDAEVDEGNDVVAEVDHAAHVGGQLGHGFVGHPLAGAFSERASVRPTAD